jgi:hypothetical protein
VAVPDGCTAVSVEKNEEQWRALPDDTATDILP